MVEKRKFDFHSERTGAALSVFVIPGAQKTEITEIRADGCVVVRLASVSVDKQCHPALFAYLGKILSVDPARFEVVAGENGEYKIISLLGVDAKKVDAKLRAELKKPAKA